MRSALPRLERIQQHLLRNRVEVLFRMFVVGDRTVVGARVAPVTTWVSVVVIVGLAGSTTGVSMTLSAPVTTAVDTGAAGAIAGTPSRDGASATSARETGLSVTNFPAVRLCTPPFAIAISPPGFSRRASPALRLTMVRPGPLAAESGGFLNSISAPGWGK